jgi:hypothetical protein
MTLVEYSADDQSFEQQPRSLYVYQVVLSSALGGIATVWLVAPNYTRTPCGFGSQLLTRPALPSRESASFSQCVLAGFRKKESLIVALAIKRRRLHLFGVCCSLPFLLQPLTSSHFREMLPFLTPDEEVMSRRFPSISAKCCLLQLMW